MADLLDESGRLGVGLGCGRLPQFGPLLQGPQLVPGHALGQLGLQLDVTLG